MKQLRPFPQATITKKGARAIEAGHPWVFDAEVLSLTPAPLDGCEAQNGDVVDVLDEKGAYLGTGLISFNSKIRVRLITRNANDKFDEAFWERKVRWAWEYRKAVMGGNATLQQQNSPSSTQETGKHTWRDLDCCRIIFSEADAFCGLIVDRYGDILVAECLTVGMDKLAPVILPLLVKVMREDGEKICAVYLRNDAKIREKEGLGLTKGWLGHPSLTIPESTRIRTSENGILYEIDLENSQKTGLFLDQKYNRQVVSRLAAGKRVLDCFTHVGTFALNAARGGAAYVHGIDISQAAIDAARNHATLNGFDRFVEFTCANAFDFLQELDEAGGRFNGKPFDFIILDPPAFTKNRKTIYEAVRGYRQINYRAMHMLPRGGYLATCSCSHFFDDKLMRETLAQAAHDANIQLKQIEARQQAPDHPIVWGIPETSYLKFFVFQII
ncbi:MAG: class I SAM-dependent rRNA methyltransferase [Coriobacteriales bacterium]|nr:class I SAM-dependent rRNA methyltransferase [Coriobacteriales bacterium]